MAVNGYQSNFPALVQAQKIDFQTYLKISEAIEANNSFLDHHIGQYRFLLNQVVFRSDADTQTFKKLQNDMVGTMLKEKLSSRLVDQCRQTAIRSLVHP